MKIENRLHKTLVCLLLSIFGTTLVASDDGIDTPRVTPPHFLDSNDKPIVLNLPPTGTGRPIMKTRMEKMREEFDGFIYNNKINDMSFVLSYPELFTDRYGLPAMTAQGLCNMKRDNGNMSLHLVAGRAYEDLSMTKLLLSYGADIKAKNEIGWTPLHHPSNVNFSKYLIMCGANFMRVDGEASPAMLAQEYKNEEKQIILHQAHDLLAARMIIEGKPHAAMSSKLAPLTKRKFLLEAIFIDRQNPSFKAKNAKDEAHRKAIFRIKKTSLESIKDEPVQNEQKVLIAKQPVKSCSPFLMQALTPSNRPINRPSNRPINRSVEKNDGTPMQQQYQSHSLTEFKSTTRLSSLNFFDNDFNDCYEDDEK